MNPYPHNDRIKSILKDNSDFVRKDSLNYLILSLFFYFLRMFTRLNVFYILVGTLLPVCMIIVALTALNLERAVFDIMGGIRNQTSNDAAYAILFFLTMMSAIAAVPLLLSYLIAIYIRWRNIRRGQNVHD